MSEILPHLSEGQAQDKQIDAEGIRARVNQIRAWQCRRLLASYESLYKQKRYAPAMDFFTRELYGPNDFSQRDQDIERAVPLMEAALSDKTLATFAVAVKLNTLSFKLDIELVRQLGEVENITADLYAQAYRACNNRAERQLQLDYIEILALELEKIANRPTIMMVLKLSRIPANLAGLGELQRILEAGASAFRKIGKVDDFIEPILTGEAEIMQQLFAGQNNLPDV